MNQFPDDFSWGAATSAYQIEGAVAEDGRAPSVWDTFSRTPGRVTNNDTGDVACDHYHRFADDIALMAQLGIRHYRFSIAWPRVIPQGRGPVNERGLAFYERLVDELLRHGITPHVTLFHWDSPQALEDRYGSWRSREIATDFAEYCSTVASRLGDRVTNWMTLNEIQCFTYFSYAVGTQPPNAPGTILDSPKQLSQVVHHALLAHGLGCQAIRAAAPRTPRLALVDNFDVYVPISETPAHIEAARRAFTSERHNGTVLVPALTGHYDEHALDRLGPDAPDIRPGDLETIHQPIDALGFNVYTAQYVRASDSDPGYEILPMPRGYPRLHMPWLYLVPETIYWGARLVSETLGRSDLPIVVSENGCACDDELTPDGEVLDLDRILYLRAHLRSTLRAIEERYPIVGYFCWSLLDNFEWTYGYSRRFGLTHVDYNTQRRTPKASFQWYHDVIRHNRVL
jgi:beta-glucosidase